MAAPVGVGIGPQSTLRDLLPEIDFEAVIDAGRDATGASLAVEVTASVNDEQQYYARNTLQWTKITTAIAALSLLQVWSSDPRVQRVAADLIEGLCRLLHSLSC